jgi:hypothetical protein
MKTRMTASLVLCALLTLAAPAARADSEYTDDDSGYLKVTSFFLEPVGRVLEWVVFRPIHAWHHFVDPTDSIEGGSRRVCNGLRPRRECGLSH